MAKLEISLLRKAYDDAAILRDVSFTVAAGALVAILGASGSGKTTLLRLIAGFETPDAGTIAIGGEVMAAAGIFRRPEARGIGYVAQDGALFPHLSVADNITFGLPRAARRAQSRVPELLRLVGLPEHYASRPPQQLSGGEQQRIALARALAPRPKLVLLDEPFSALDAGLRAETRAAVATALAAAGATAILVTHDQEEALSMGALAGVLQNGVLSALVPPEILYRHPATPGLAHFIGDAVMMRGIAAGADVDCALGLLRIPAGVPSGPVDVMVRPEQIKLNLGYIPGSVPAVIRNIRFFGHDAVVELAVSQAGEQVTARVFSHAVPKAGSDVWLHVEGEVVAYAADRVGA